MICLLGLVLPASPGAPPAFAQSLETREQELAQIREQIESLRSRVASMRERETTLEDQLKRLRAELDLQQARLDEADTALELATARAAATEARVVELEADLGSVRDDLRRRMVGLYRLGRHGYLRLFLTIEADDGLLPAIRQLRYLVRRDRRSVDRYLALRDDLLAQQTRLELERAEVAQWQAQEKERRDELATLRRRHERLLAKAAAERRLLASQASELEDTERKLVELLSGFVGDDQAPLEGTPIQEFRGVLDWPLQGQVRVEFGPRKDPRYRTEVPHNGIEMATGHGSKVRVVFPGSVVWAGDFEGYGPMVVVLHPGKVFTLYAGLQLLNVGEGDVLSLGDVIGASSDRLYFEIRADKQPRDPREWLR